MAELSKNKILTLKCVPCDEEAYQKVEKIKGSLKVKVSNEEKPFTSKQLNNQEGIRLLPNNKIKIRYTYSVYNIHTRSGHQCNTHNMNKHIQYTCMMYVTHVHTYKLTHSHILYKKYLVY